MIFDECWKNLKKRNPKLGEDDTRMTIRVAELRRMLELFYEQGKDHAQSIHRLLGNIFREAGRG